MVHEGFAGNVLSDIKINKWAVLSSWKTPLGLFILLISDTRGTMAVIQAYLQSPLTKPGAFGPEAEPKAIYCPRTQEHVVDVVVFVYHYNKDDATCSGLCCFFKHTLRFNRGPWVLQEPSWLSFHFFTELREIQACVVLCECIVYPCELCNNITAGCIFPPSTCCPWLHGLWPSKQWNTVKWRKQSGSDVADVIYLLSYFLFYYPADLENFKTHRRSSVSVREGQGVVLLCGPPPHSGGKTTQWDHNVKDYSVFRLVLSSAHLWFEQNCMSHSLILHLYTKSYRGWPSRIIHILLCYLTKATG